MYHGRFPGERAASLFAAKECESFANLGISVTLLVPQRRKRVKIDPHEYYCVQENFTIVYLPTLDIPLIPLSFNFKLSLIIFSLTSLWYLAHRTGREDIIYSNEMIPLLISSMRFRHTFYALHAFPEKNIWLHQILFRRVRGIITTNRWMKERLKEKFRVQEKKIFFEPNAVDLEKFDIALTKEDARKKLDLPLSGFLAVYTGHLYSWKGVDTLARAASLLGVKDKVIFVGGSDNDLKIFREKYEDSPNIRIMGYRPHSEVPTWQKAADVLVLPNTAKEDISKYYTSPMKLFEYMASRTPVVATRIPSIEEILTEQIATLVTPDDFAEMAKGILEVKDKTKESLLKATRAFEKVSEHSWKKRAQRILNFFNVEQE